jgi:hypothetical protein
MAPDELDGSDAVHRQLVAWLVMLGLREPLALEAGEPVRLRDFQRAGSVEA